MLMDSFSEVDVGSHYISQMAAHLDSQMDAQLESQMASQLDSQRVSQRSSQRPSTSSQLLQRRKKRVLPSNNSMIPNLQNRQLESSGGSDEDENKF